MRPLTDAQCELGAIAKQLEAQSPDANRGRDRWRRRRSNDRAPEDAAQNLRDDARAHSTSAPARMALFVDA